MPTIQLTIQSKLIRNHVFGGDWTGHLGEFAGNVASGNIGGAIGNFQGDFATDAPGGISPVNYHPGNYAATPGQQIVTEGAAGSSSLIGGGLDLMTLAVVAGVLIMILKKGN